MRRYCSTALLLLMVTVFWGCGHSSHELKWNQQDGYRWAELPDKPGGREAGFRLISGSDTDIGFQNTLEEDDIVENRNYLNGSGVAAGDVDGDGLSDLYFARMDGPNRLYKNLGAFRFRDITDSAGVAHNGYYSTGTVLADVDGDYDLDLLITSMSRENVLYLNNGKGHFKKVTDSGLGKSHGSTTLALADIDGDGDLDLYIANYKEKSAKDLFGFNQLSWENTTTRDGNSYRLTPPFDQHYTIIYGDDGPTKREYGKEDELYINDGKGRFEKVSEPENIFRDHDGKPLGLERDWGLTAKFQDVNGDLLPDLYVCNDFWTPDRFWINQGNGTFNSVDPLAVRNYSFSSMGVDFSDINRDGALDFFVTEMLSGSHERRMRQLASFSPVPISIGEIDNQPQYMRNTLYLNRGDQTFAEIARYSGVDASEWSWATHFLDVDLDGFEDILINTGNAYDVLDLDTQEALNQRYFKSDESMEGYILEYPSLRLRNKIYRNNRDLTFSEVSSEWGFDEKDISHGMAMADLDNDGDLDVASNRLNETAAIFENRASAARIAIRLKGRTPNTQAIGSKIKLEGGPALQTKEITAGGNYLSGSDPLTVFAADPENPRHIVAVTWPDGMQTTIDSVRSNRIYEIDQPAKATDSSIGNMTASDEEPIFLDVTGRIGHTHSEEPYDEDRLQPMLPIHLSRLGPGVSWIDYDRDQDDDLFIASGRGGKTGIFENNGNGKFSKVNLGPISDPAAGDQTTILGWAIGDNALLTVGSSNYEQETAAVASAHKYSLGLDGTIEKQELPGIFSTTGPMAAADYDGDGNPDLFIGGRVVPDHYPMDASSRLLTYRDGGFVLDKENSETLKDIGLVTGALFSDIDTDGDPDLLLSREWDSLLLLENNGGTFSDVSEQYGLREHKGWWNGIATGDFNSDGHPDIIATNWGLNSMYRLESGNPLKMYYGDFDSDRQLDIIESYFDTEIGAYVPRRRLYELYKSIKTIAGNMRSHAEFARSSLGEILSSDPQSLSSKEIVTLTHTLFINRGDHFSATPLPAEAQFSAAFYAGVADYDNDGNEDLFLSQNFFALPTLTSRLDAGRGLWLKGDGNGNLSPVSGSKSGIKVYGEQRGAALGDFNGDGKVDLAVSQNGAATRLYENQTKNPGLSIRLAGPESNRSGIGSSLRLVYRDGSKGPRREVQAGSGYWSQNSAVQVLGASGEPAAIEVTWFDGKVETYEISLDQKQFALPYR